MFGYNQDRIATATSTYSPFDKGWQAALASERPHGRGPRLFGAGPGRGAGGLHRHLHHRPRDAARNLHRTGADPAGWHLLGNPYPGPARLEHDDRGRGPATWRTWTRVYVFQSSGPYAGTYRTYLASSPGQRLAPGAGRLRASSCTPPRPARPARVRFTNANRVTTFGRAARLRPRRGRRPPGAYAGPAPAAGLTDALTVYADPAATAGVDAAVRRRQAAQPQRPEPVGGWPPPAR